MISELCKIWIYIGIKKALNPCDWISAVLCVWIWFGIIYNSSTVADYTVNILHCQYKNHAICGVLFRIMEMEVCTLSDGSWYFVLIRLGLLADQTLFSSQFFGRGFILYLLLGI